MRIFVSKVFLARKLASEGFDLSEALTCCNLSLKQEKPSWEEVRGLTTKIKL